MLKMSLLLIEFAANFQNDILIFTARLVRLWYRSAVDWQVLNSNDSVNDREYFRLTNFRVSL
jgi:hypothetical protein